MPVSRILLLAVILFACRQTATAVLAYFLRTPISGAQFAIGYVVDALVASLVFATIVFIHPSATFGHLAVVGLLSYVFGLAATKLVTGMLVLDAGFMTWDLFQLAASMVIGLILGRKLRKLKRAAN